MLLLLKKHNKAGAQINGLFSQHPKMKLSKYIIVHNNQSVIHNYFQKHHKKVKKQIFESVPFFVL